MLLHQKLTIFVFVRNKGKLFAQTVCERFSNFLLRFSIISRLALVKEIILEEILKRATISVSRSRPVRLRESAFLSVSGILFITSRELDDFQSVQNVLYCKFCFRGKNPSLLFLFSVYLCKTCFKTCPLLWCTAARLLFAVQYGKKESVREPKILWELQFCLLIIFKPSETATATVDDLLVLYSIGGLYFHFVMNTFANIFWLYLVTSEIKWSLTTSISILGTIKRLSVIVFIAGLARKRFV